MDTCKLQEENLDASVDAGDRCENTQHGGTGELLGWWRLAVLAMMISCRSRAGGTGCWHLSCWQETAKPTQRTGAAGAKQGGCCRRRLCSLKANL